MVAVILVDSGRGWAVGRVDVVGFNFTKKITNYSKVYFNTSSYGMGIYLLKNKVLKRPQKLSSLKSLGIRNPLSVPGIFAPASITNGRQR